MHNIEKNNNPENRKINHQNEHLKFIEEKEITNANGDLVFDLKKFINVNWFKGEAIIATRNIPSNKLEELIQELRLCANNPEDPLDLEIKIYDALGSNENEKKGKEKETLKEGPEGKHKILIYIYPEEFFKSDPKATEYFYEKIVPDIGNFKQYQNGRAS